jgi:GTPase SAR1 family protein
LLIRSTWKVDNFWIREINEHYPNTPRILLGLKNDLRDNPKEWMVSISF